MEALKSRAIGADAKDAVRAVKRLGALMKYGTSGRQLRAAAAILELAASLGLLGLVGRDDG